MRIGKEIAVLTENNTNEIKKFVKNINRLNPEDKLFRIKNKMKYDKGCKVYLFVGDEVELQLRCRPAVKKYLVVCQNTASGYNEVDKTDQAEGNQSERDAAEGLQQEGQKTDGDQLWTVLTPVLCTLVLISIFLILGLICYKYWENIKVSCLFYYLFDLNYV